MKPSLLLLPSLFLASHAQGAEAPAPPQSELPTQAAAELAEWNVAKQSLPDLLSRRIRSALRQRHGARVDLRDSVDLLYPDGHQIIFAIYEFNRLEQCVLRAGGDRKAATSKCTEELGTLLNEARYTKACTTRGVVRAALAAPTPGKPSGALTLEAALPLEVGCTHVKTLAFALDDLDADGKGELQVHLLSETRDRAFITGEQEGDAGTREERFSKRHLFVLRTDLRPQVRREMASFEATGEIQFGDQNNRVHRHTLSDTNSDQHPDLVFESVTYLSLGGCGEDELGWPKLDGDPDEEEECSGEVSRSVWLYVPATDEWVDPKPAKK